MATLDFTDDYSYVWDNVESITYRSAQSLPSETLTTYTDKTVATALRGQPGMKERAPTAGVTPVRTYFGAYPATCSSARPSFPSRATWCSTPLARRGRSCPAITTRWTTFISATPST